MADHRILIPFIFHFAAGVYGKDGKDLHLPIQRQFELARLRGWSDDPDDPGGATMIDVTLSTYASFRRNAGFARPLKEDLRNISFIEWQTIFKSMFWDRCKADLIAAQGVANMLADWIWASGPAAIRMAQKTIGTKPDGIVGQHTLEAIAQSDAETLFFSLRDAREAHFRRCRGAWKYLRGWLRRLHALQPDGSFDFRGNTHIAALQR